MDSDHIEKADQEIEILHMKWSFAFLQDDPLAELHDL